MSIKLLVTGSIAFYILSAGFAGVMNVSILGGAIVVGVLLAVIYVLHMVQKHLDKKLNALKAESVRLEKLLVDKIAAIDALMDDADVIRGLQERNKK